MVDIFLVICTLVGLAILLIISLYLLVYYQHPDDHNEAWIPKIVVILGFVLAGATVLLFPLDVANNEGYAGCAGYDTSFCGGLPMEFFWNMVFWLIPVWVFFLIPFSTFYYEADDGMLMAGTAYSPNPIKRSRVGQAVCYQIFVFIIIGVIFLVTYLGLSDTKIPVREFVGAEIGSVTEGSDNNNGILVFTTPALTGNATFNPASLEPVTTAELQYSVVKNTEMQEIMLQVSVSTFYAGLMAWLGWFLFALFGGIGLAALPLDLILAYKNRPHHMDAVEYAEAQLSLRERTNELVEIGELIKVEHEKKTQAGLVSAFGRFSLDGETREAARDERQAILGFKQAVYLLEKDVEDFQNMTSNYENYNPLIPYIQLICGVCSIIISIFWLIHLMVYVFPSEPLAPFLNNYFEWFDKWFPLFGVLSVALFVLYLLICAVKGAFKFGIRFMFFQIHPMKVGKTYMSSFMFNIGLVLLCALPVVQLAQDAFADYAAFSEIRQIFGVQVQFLQFFSIFFENNIFVYAFMAFSVITVIYLCCRPKDEAANPQALRDRLRAHRPGGAK